MSAPTIDHLLTLRATYVQRSETVLGDGDVTTTDARFPDTPCFIERMTVLEIRDNEQVSIAQWRGFFLPSFIAKAGDALEVATLTPELPPLVLEFVGPVEPIANPLGRYVHHTEARLREVA
jgi:hypothetical protein